MRRRHHGVAVLLLALKNDWFSEVNVESVGYLIGKHSELTCLSTSHPGLYRTDMIINRLIVCAVNRGALTA